MVEESTGTQAPRAVRHPRLWRALANGATVANALCGVGAIAYVVLGNKLFALALIFIGIGWDGLDGLFARRSGMPPRLFGRVADSVADAITFALAPAAIIYFDNYPTSLWSPYQTLALGVAVLVGSLAIARLVYFTLKAHMLEHFLGASVPQNAMALVLLVLLVENPGYLGIFPLLFLVAASLLALLMVLPLAYPKMRKFRALRWVTIAMTVLDVFALAIPNFRPSEGSLPYQLAFALALGGFFLLASFYVAGPLLVSAEGKAKPGKPAARDHEG